MEEIKKERVIKDPLTEDEKKAAHEKYQDKELTCARCGAKFIFGAETQYWYFDKKHYKSDGVTEVKFVQPILCKACNAKHKDEIRRIRDLKREGKSVSYDKITGIITVADSSAPAATATLIAPAVDEAKKA
jgi:5-methylcytosine-specific restriction endonuclease McrA